MNLLDQYRQNGYGVVPGLFSLDEVALYRKHFMDLRAASSYPNDFDGGNTQSNDPMKKYPSLVNMHCWDALSLDWLLDDRLWQHITTLLGQESYAVQTMVHFKPSGARGQALHQDQYWLRVQPGTCMGAWLALDQCYEENGCIQVVPGTHTLSLLCTVQGDMTQSFSSVTVPLPEGMKPTPLIMEPGDVLFFDGQLIHGSFPNTSIDQFRRALIGHYISGEAEKVAAWYNPVLCRDGSQVMLETNEWGGPCGIWVEDQSGKPVVEISGKEEGVRI